MKTIQTKSIRTSMFRVRGLLAIYRSWMLNVAIFATAGSALADVHYVDVNSTNATPPHTNWTTAARAIQDAVDATAPAKASIPWSQIGAKAGADYQGDGLAVLPAAGGARLRCVFQRLEGEATREGLWLTSTVTNGVNDRFRVTAVEVGRLDGASEVPALAGLGSESSPHTGGAMAGPAKAGTPNQPLPRTGTVQVTDKLVRFTRPGVIEEYSVSMDGVRQDFIIEHPPLNSQPTSGELVVRLAVSGAKVEPAAGGAQLVLENSGRKIAYSRLRVTDATGKELTARMEVISSDQVGRVTPCAPMPADIDSDSETRDGAHGVTRPTMLLVVVNDADAVYPVRIDPTFSDANWISMGGFPGANGAVNAMVVDGSGNLYICGNFTFIGNTSANHIAKWNGSSWSALGSGLDGTNGLYPSFFALAVSGSDVYAGGFFNVAGGSPAYYIAKWNGSTWTNLSSGMDGTVYALAVSGNDLYAGGYFTTAGSNPANYIAKWDGSNWTALGSGMDSYVSALAVSGSDLYAGGGFTMAGGNPANHIATWNGSTWLAQGSGLNNPVLTLAVSGSTVYAGGNFTMAGGNPANYIAQWDGLGWTGLGSGMSGAVSSLAVSGSDLYAGGSFTIAGSIAATNVAKWNGSTWAALGPGVNSSVSALAMYGSDVYAGGNFTMAGGSLAYYIAKWNGSTWTNLSSGMSALNGAVQALAVSGSDLYAGGYFFTAGGSAANRIAKWNGSGWSPLGSGMSGGGGHFAFGSLPPYVSALAVSGRNLYAGGYFTNAGGGAANYIAKWDGSDWSALGSGMDGGLHIFSDFYPPYVSALAVSGSNVYAGGWFTTAGGSAATNIAKWNGSSWSALGSGIGSGFFGDHSEVFALAVSGNDLYAGGSFTTAGGNPANYIAEWDGSNWTALGPGMNGRVDALVVSGSGLYAGGTFTTAGGNPASYIAMWNGTVWTNLGSGMSGTVSALAVSGGNVYAGGSFTNADGSAANYIAKWDGSSWSALGSGMNNSVYALAVSGSDLYAGGGFTTAGGKVSAYLARAIVNPPVLAIEGDGDGGYFIRFSGVPGSAYRLQRAPGVSGPWSASGPQTAPATGLVEFWDLFPPPGQGFYRSVQP